MRREEWRCVHARKPCGKSKDVRRPAPPVLGRRRRSRCGALAAPALEVAAGFPGVSGCAAGCAGAAAAVGHGQPVGVSADDACAAVPCLAARQSRWARRGCSTAQSPRGSFERASLSAANCPHPSKRRQPGLERRAAPRRWSRHGTTRHSWRHASRLR